MKIIMIGGSGTIGRAVAHELKARHEVITVGHSEGDVRVDITDITAIEKMYKQIGRFDALVATAGKVHFGALKEMTAAHYAIGLNDKLMGQVNLVLAALPYIKDGGSFTLTSGLLNNDPIVYGSSAAMVNGALEGFVKSAAIELPRGLRINVVSPTVITEALDAYAPYFRGYKSIPAAEAALAYSKSVEGMQTGQTYRVGW